jgi:hypothetical protein
MSGGPDPGALAPDFELLSTDGDRVRLSQQRGRPVVLVFGSVTCPVARGGVPSLKKLYDEGYDAAAAWFEIYVREAHPGENYPAPSTFDEKMSHAQDFRRLESIPWPVLVDDLEGTVHRAYGELPNMAYVIDADGRVAFTDKWASAVTLRQVLDDLNARGGRGAPSGAGTERMMHIAGPMARGWHAIERAGAQSVQDTIRAMPPLAMMLWMGQFLKPALEPLAVRTEAFPAPVKVAGTLAVAFVGTALLQRVFED